MSEIRDFHPVVADWLTANGYTHQHHVKMPIGGNADFVATKDGKTFVVECKVGAPSYRYIIQVLDYASQIEGAIPMLFSNETTDAFTKICADKGVLLYVLDVVMATDGVGSFSRVSAEQIASRAILVDRVRFKPVDVMREVVTLHDKIPSCAIKDLWEIHQRSRVGDTIPFIREYMDTHPEYEDVCREYIHVVNGGVVMYSLLTNIYVHGHVNDEIISLLTPGVNAVTRPVFTEHMNVQHRRHGNLLGLSGDVDSLTTYIDGAECIAVGLFDETFTQASIDRALALIPYHNSLMPDDDRESMGEYDAAFIILPYAEYRRIVDMSDRDDVFDTDSRIALYGAWLNPEGKVEIGGGFWLDGGAS